MTLEVPVVPIYSKTPEGYRVRAYQLSPERVRIRGPEERVKGIARVGTDPVDLSGVVSQKEFRTAVNLGDAQVRLEVPTTITLKVTLEKNSQRDFN
jgi:YbbR domain-containing protein